MDDMHEATAFNVKRMIENAKWRLDTQTENPVRMLEALAEAFDSLKDARQHIGLLKEFEAKQGGTPQLL